MCTVIYMFSVTCGLILATDLYQNHTNNLIHFQYTTLTVGLGIKHQYSVLIELCLKIVMH